jgi:hypothetical protein
MDHENLVGRINGTYAVYEGGAFDYAAKAVTLAAANGIEMAVGIVGMDNDQPGLAGGSSKADRHYDQ